MVESFSEARRRPRPRRLNVRFAIGLAVAAVALGTGVWLAHAVQVRRTARNMLGRAEQAETEFRKLQLQASDEQVRAALAEAVRRFDAYLLYAPEDKQARTKLALLVAEQAKLSQGNVKVLLNAYRVLERAASLQPDNLELIRRLAETAMEVQQMGVAAESFKRLIQKYPEDTDLLLKLAQCQAATERYRDAIATYQDIISRDPRNLVAYVALADLYRRPQVDDAENGDAVINQMVASNPDSPRAFAERAMYWLRVTQSERNELEAKEALRQARTDVAAALAKAPDDIDSTLAAAELALVDRQLDQVEQYLGRAEALYPNHRRVNELRTRLSRLRNRPDEERMALEKSDSRDPMKLFHLADAMLRQNPPDVDGARKIIREFRKAGYREEVTEYLNARILLAEGKVREATTALERLAVKVSHWPEFRMMVDLYLSACYEQLGLPDRQMEVCQRILKEDPTLVPARAGYAATLLRMGKVDEAYKEWQRLEQSMGTEEFLKVPAFRLAMFQCLMARTERLPEAQRDWGPVEQLLADLAKVGEVDAGQVALMRAELLVRQGRLQEARDVVAAQRDAHPDQLALWTALANVTAMSGEARGALALLDEAAKRFGRSAGVLLARISLAVRLEPAAGREVLAAVRSEADQLPEAERVGIWQALGAAYYRLRDRQIARQLWEQAAAARPNDSRLRLVLFELARETGDELGMRQWADAIKALLGEQSPDWRFAEASRLVWQAQARPEESKEASLARAKDLLKAAGEARPTWHEVPRLQAEIAVLEGRVDEAIDLYQRADSLGALGPISLGQLVRLLYLRGRDDEAKALMERLGPEPPSPVMQRLFAEIELREGDLEEAIQRAQKSVADSQHPVDHLWYGQLLARARRYPEAEAALRRAIELDPRIAECWLALVAVLVQADRKADAQQALQEAQIKLPEDRTPLALAVGYEMLGDLSAAEQHYLNAAELQPANLAVARRVADFYLRHNRGEQARRFLSELVQLAEKDPRRYAAELVWGRRALASVLASSGDYRQQEQALALLDQNAQGGRPSADDLRMKAVILAGRPDRSSKLKAIGIYEGLLGRKLNLSTEDQFRLARLYDETNRWQNCRELMTELTTKHRKDARLLAAYILMLLRREAVPADVRPLVERLVELQPGAPMTVAIEARLLVKEGKADEAVRRLESLIPKPLPPDQAARLADVGALLEELGQLEPAERMFSEFAEKVPGGSLVLAAFLGRRGQVDRALDQCQAALDDAPLPNVLSVAVAVVRENTNRLTPQAIQRVQSWFDKALAEDASSKLVQVQWAMFLDVQGKYDELVRTYRDLLARTDLPDREKAVLWNNLAYVLAASEQGGTEPLELVGRAIEILGPTPELLDTRSLANLAAGQFQAAVADARQSIADNPTGMKYFHLARALLAAGDRDGASRALQVARDNHRLTPDRVPPLERKHFDKLVALVGRA